MAKKKKKKLKRGVLPVREEKDSRSRKEGVQKQSERF